MSEAPGRPPAEDSRRLRFHTRAGRPRAAGLVALFWSGYLLILFTVPLLKPHAPPGLGPLLWGALSGLLLVLLTLLFLKFEGRGAASAGIRLERGGLSRLTAGMAAGLVIYWINFLPAGLLAGGALQVSRNPAPPSFDAVALAVCAILALSFMEELGFRGWTLWRLHESFGLRSALLVTSAAFGLCHLLFGWSWRAVLTGVIPCGLLFGAAALVFRGLAVPVGIHAGLNLAAWAVGEKGNSGFWRITMEEGAAGRVRGIAPLSGAAIVLLCALLLLLWSKRRGRVEPADCRRSGRRE